MCAWDATCRRLQESHAEAVAFCAGSGDSDSTAEESFASEMGVAACDFLQHHQPSSASPSHIPSVLISPRYEPQKLCLAIRAVGVPNNGLTTKQRRPKGYWKHKYIQKQEKTHHPPVKLAVRGCCSTLQQYPVTGIYEFYTFFIIFNMILW